MNNIYNIIYSVYGNGFPTFSYSEKNTTVYFGVFDETETLNEYCIRHMNSFIDSYREIQDIPCHKRYGESHIQTLETIIALLKNTSEEVLMEVLTKVVVAKYSNEKIYSNRQLPKRDNKGYYAGGGSPHRGDCIRKPSTKHKNQWKQFIKLFPQYTEEYNKIFNEK